jgi:plastocyanin
MLRPVARRALQLSALLLLIPALAPAPAGAAGGSVSGAIEVLKKGGAGRHREANNAVVWLSGPKSPAPESPVMVNQLKKKFRPRVLPVVQGQVVHFMNQDRIEHNVFSRGGEGFDLGRYPKSEFRPVTFDKPGVFKVYCNIHKAMILDVVVLENRYFAVTDDEGVFAIEGVPPGSYKLNVWHVYGGSHTRDVEVANEPLAIQPITVTSTKVVRDVEEHFDKQGKPYTNKKKRYKRR